METLKELYDRLNAEKETHIWVYDRHLQKSDLDDEKYELIEVEDNIDNYYIIVREK